MGLAMTTNTYLDLCKEIDILDIRISSLEREREHLRRMMFANAPSGVRTIDYSSERVSSSFSPMPFDEIYSRVKDIDKTLEPLYKIMDEKQDAKRKMEVKISEFEGIDYKVAFMRMQGKSLIEIADELGYSYDWIRKVSSRLNKSTLKKAHEEHKNLEKM
ncbi:hypothetical protein [Heyndrickxia oleronia]|uniref:hypothetical protein n=1 Tax=Heyndrickxia oleronia TaxID=38875 RepID=UPI001C0EF812|nr:hypothetical protein [Heyndrickxia oleronia]MBU5214938.1 hypothetical protein [Heyndrickxia oleronia]